MKRIVVLLCVSFAGCLAAVSYDEEVASVESQRSVVPEPETIQPQLDNCRLGCVDNYDCQNVGGSPRCGTCQGGRCGGSEPVAPGVLGEQKAWSSVRPQG